MAPWFRNSSGELTQEFPQLDRRIINRVYHDAQLIGKTTNDQNMILLELNLRMAMDANWNPYCRTTQKDGTLRPPPNDEAISHRRFYISEVNHLIDKINSDGFKISSTFAKGLPAAIADVFLKLMDKITHNIPKEESFIHCKKAGILAVPSKKTDIN